jgi:hypothetical protein
MSLEKKSGDMMEEEENQKDMESKEDEEVPSLLDVEKRLANNEGEGIFACPQCGTGVDANAPNCPHCGIAFEEVPTVASAATNEEHMPTVAELGEEQTAETAVEETTTAPIEEPTEITTPLKPQTDMKVKGAIADYYDKRKKRYLLGALSLGLGIVLFVLLWLVVVNSVLVSEEANVFGFSSLALLIVAGVFFILGLYLTLTYPSSSLSELLTSMSANTPPKKSH